MDSLWLHVRRVLKQTLNADLFSQWIEPLESTTLPSGDLMLEVPNRFHYDWIREHYLSEIQSCCNKIDRGLRVLLRLPDAKRKPAKFFRPYFRDVPLTTNFHPSRTFETYAVAPFNQFAFAAAQDVCHDGAPKFNPLFIEGPPGLGKTHLLQAIGNGWLAKTDSRASYLNCRNFPAYGGSASSDSLKTTLESLAIVRIFLVDDVHLLPREGGFQEHLRELFDLCYDSDTQMVFAASRLPHQIPDLTTGLRSRLGRGLIARIRQPDIKSCYEIVTALLGETEVEVSPDVGQHLVLEGPVDFHKIRDYVERLKEFVEKVGLPSNLEEKPLAINENGTPGPQELSIQVIQKEVCDAYAVSMEALQGTTKLRPLVIPRQVGMYLGRKLTASTYAGIGKAFGGRDHSTVIYACRKVRAEMKRNRRFAQRVVEIEKKLSRFHKVEYPVKPEV